VLTSIKSKKLVRWRPEHIKKLILHQLIRMFWPEPIGSMKACQTKTWAYTACQEYILSKHAAALTVRAWLWKNKIPGRKYKEPKADLPRLKQVKIIFTQQGTSCIVNCYWTCQIQLWTVKLISPESKLVVASWNVYMFSSWLLDSR
jgi:hypothetical protein